TPGGNVTINVGETVSFTGTGNDPDNNLPLSYLWDFGDQAIADSTQEDPGVVQFNNVGTFTVTFTVTDSLGLPDPTPAQIVVDVVSPAVIIVDNTDPGFSKVGSWSTYLCGACYGANYFVTGAGTGSKKATWTFQIGAPGEYEISAQWASKFDRATNAPYTIKNNTTTLATVFVDQTVNGGQFNLLGTYTLQAGTLQVTLTNNANGKVVADAVQITASQVFGVISPSDLDLKTSQDILVEALVVGFPSGWGVEFTVKEKDSGNIIQQVEDYNRPFELQLSGLALQEYTVDALLIDQNGVFQSPFSDHVEFGVGDYYVGFGDSITRGSGDNIVSDNVSADGRNSGGGYEPILNNLLTTNKGYPHTVKNEGVSGNLSIDGLNRVSTMLSSHPDSQYLLILFGTNDAKSSPPVPSGMGLNPGDPGYNGTFKDNVQRIIDAVINEGKIPLLAKVPYALGSSSNGTPFPDPDTAPQNMLIQEYNVVIDELISANNIQVSPPDLFVAPDLYNHFRNNYLNNGGSEYADNLHPNGTGYQSIANLWEVSIFPSP
ncbi:MAG TPA: GDSL-type esterase/lipase family protein, partial [Thermodesulfobacteriota bacterium]|nr:GDSL-type esterase/lipase family protein [Thermodesulfobacteriota bacterium]